MSEGAETSVIRRRHVIYVEGYDPQGAKGYYRLFERGFARFLKLWPLRALLGPLVVESQNFARWDVEANAQNWSVSTRYDFLRQEHIIRGNMAEPLWRQLPRAMGWAANYVLSGALWRVFRASGYFGSVLLYFQTMVLLWLGLSVAGGWFAGLAASRFAGTPLAGNIVIGLGAALVIFVLLRRLALRWFVIQINNHWPHLCAFARGEPTCFDQPIEACAQRLLAAVRANEADEIVVIGHSGGGALAPAVLVRALQLDPDVGRRGPPVVLLTLGSIAPGAALHPRAEKLRSLFARMAVETSVRWIDCQTRLDVMNFWDFDPVEGVGVDAGPERCNPLVWNLRLRDMLNDEFINRNRLDFFRLHYQFIMANDKRAPYDFFLLVCGPLPVTVWAENPLATLARFASDGTLSSPSLD
jgi:hypothetical protein